MDINELQVAAKRGDKSSEQQLFKKLSVRFHHFLNHKVSSDEDIEDIIQTALMTIAREYKNIEFTRSFSAWAYKVLINVYLNYYKKKKADKGKQVFLPDYNAIPGGWTADPHFEKILIDCLRKISSGNNRYARILNFFYQGFSTEEVCRKLKISSANAYVILSRARSLLKTCLEKGDLKQ